MRALVAVLVLVLGAVFGAQPALAAGKRVALVVGNAAYVHTKPLANTVNDAEAVAAALTRLGFNVHTAYDETQAGLLDAMQRFTADLAGAEAGLFYYAGHGIQVGSENYILPVDIRLENELSLRYQAVALADVLDSLERLPKVAIVVLDACRDNPLADSLDAAAGRSTGATRGLARVVPRGNGTLVAYAAAPGAVASDGTGDHSPYTEALLAEMEVPGVEVALVFRRVAGRVLAATAGEQRPELLVRLVDEFYLAGVPEGAAPQAAPAATVTVAVATAPEADRTPEREGRPALWGYYAKLREDVATAPAAAWTPPAGVAVAEVEANSSFGTAQAVGVEDTLSLSFVAPGDADWFRFEVGQGGQLTVEAASPPQGIAPAVRLVDANGYEAAGWQSAPRPGGTLFARFDIQRPGVYRLHFADNASQAAPESFAVTLGYGVNPDPWEGNDRIDLATVLPPDGLSRPTLFPRGDIDWFSYALPAAGALVVSLTQVPEAVDPTFRLVDADGAEAASWRAAPRPGGDNVAVLEVPRPGTYFLHLADGNNDAAALQPITMLTRFAPSPDTLEPNDSMGMATSVAESGEVKVALFPRGDTDFIELNLMQPGELHFAIADPPENIDPALRIVDASGYEAQGWAQAPRPGGDLEGWFAVSRPGRYFLQLSDGNNDASSVEPMTLALDFVASLDAFEPNDGFGAARPLTAGGSVPFTILPRGDSDWFRVSVDEPGELRVNIDEGPENLDLAYHVYNTDRYELAGWVPAYRPGGLTEGMVDLPRPGTYFIEVRDGNNDASSILPATLSTVFTPTRNAAEPNDSFGQAVLVEVGGESLAHILPRGDADWLMFDVAGPGTLDVSVTGVPPELDVAFRVVNAEQYDVGGWAVAPRPGGDTSATIALPAAGRYWLELRDGNNDARSPLPFRVTRSFRPAG